MIAAPSVVDEGQAYKIVAITGTRGSPSGLAATTLQVLLYLRCTSVSPSLSARLTIDHHISIIITLM